MGMQVQTSAFFYEKVVGCCWKRVNWMLSKLYRQREMCEQCVSKQVGQESV